MNEKPAQIQLYEVKIEIIDKRHNVGDFKSYEQELVDFLQEDALDNQQKNLSVTFLWFYQNRLVSYITLLTDRITLEGNLREYFRGKGILYKTLPALKIGRLCVDDEFRGRGLGRLMIQFAVQIAKNINKNEAGCRFITVDAKRNTDQDLDSIHFYKKLRFETMEDDPARRITFMRFDLQSAQQH